MVDSAPGPVYVHVGYPKSASTTLQKHLFNKHPEINNLGLFPTGNVGRDSDYIDHSSEYLSNPDLRTLYHNLVMLEGIQYVNSDTDSLFEESIADLIADDGHKATVFSNERFVSVFYAHDDLREKAERVQNLLPDAKILFVIRNQIDLIKSQYRDWPIDPRSFAIGDPVSLDRWVDIAFESDSVCFLESLQYYDVIEYYADLFGSDNVGVFLLEDLIRDPAAFANSIATFMDIETGTAIDLLDRKQENKGVSKRYNTYRRLRRRLLSVTNLQSWLPDPVEKPLRRTDRLVRSVVKGGKKEQPSFDTGTEQKLQSYYSTKNKRLSDEYGLDLEGSAYPGYGSETA